MANNQEKLLLMLQPFILQTQLHQTEQNKKSQRKQKIKPTTPKPSATTAIERNTTLKQ
jgi:hypothetical protein